MKPAPFEYRQPRSVAEALAALRETEDAMIIAGGQSLLPMLNLRVATAECLVDISRLDDLRHHRDVGGVFSIGALVTHSEIEDGCGREAFNGLLQRVASKLAYRAVRNVGTIGGSLALNDPAADWPACMLALGATIIVATDGGTREIPVEDFLIDAYTTALEQRDLLLRIDITVPRDCRWGVSKVTRKSGAFADSLSIAVTGCDDHPARVVLTGTESCAQLLAQTSARLAQDPDVGGEDLADAILQDIAAVHEDADPYQARCHMHTVTSAIAEAKSWPR